MNYKIGDKVIAITDISQDGGPERGDTGIIRVINDDEVPLGIEWDNFSGGHNLSGKGKLDNHCWWVSETDVEKE